MNLLSRMSAVAVSSSCTMLKNVIGLASAGSSCWASTEVEQPYEQRTRRSNVHVGVAVGVNQAREVLSSWAGGVELIVSPRVSAGAMRVPRGCGAVMESEWRENGPDSRCR